LISPNFVAIVTRGSIFLNSMVIIAECNKGAQREAMGNRQWSVDELWVITIERDAERSSMLTHH
jgi:hypothetical protein